MELINRASNIFVVELCMVVLFFGLGLLEPATFFFGTFLVGPIIIGFITYFSVVKRRLPTSEDKARKEVNRMILFNVIFLIIPIIFLFSFITHSPFDNLMSL